MAIFREPVQVRLRAKSTVIPGDPTHPSFYHQLSPLAATVIKDVYMHCIYFFASDQSSSSMNLEDPNMIVESLKISLSAAISHFPVATGRLRTRGEDAGGGLIIKCNDGGIRFLEAYTASTLADLLSEKDHDLRGIDRLIYSEPKLMDYTLNSLALVQITEFSCGGIAIGLSWSHVMADALSMTVFMEIWGEVHRGRQIKEPPCIIDDSSHTSHPPKCEGKVPLVVHDVFLPGSNQASICHEGDEGCREILQTVVLRLSGVEVTRSCNEDMDLNFKVENGSLSSNSFLSATALLWKCICRARVHYKINNVVKSQLNRCVIFRDNRKLLQSSSVSDRIYFGNALQIVSISDYSSIGCAGQLSRIANLIRETLDQRPDACNLYRDLTQMAGDEKFDNDDASILMCYWADLPFYEVEFKFGKPIQVLSGMQTPYNNCRGESFFLQPAEDFDLHSSSCSLEAVISLQPEHLQNLLQDELFLKHLDS